MEAQTYKPSLFNRICNNKDTMVLFNSYQGIKSIHTVSNDNKQQVYNLLNSNYVVRNGDALIEKLINFGFLVHSSVDEKLRREALYEEICNNNNLHLLVYTTNDCNFRCKYCAQDFCKQPITQETKNGIIEFIRKNIHKYSSVSIDWFGGEPLLEIDSIEYISKHVKEICQKAHKPYSGLITSNGYLLTPKNIQKLIECNVLNYTITIDGLKKTHDNQRVLSNGNGTFDKIINNLLWMKDNIKTKTLNIIIRTNMTKEILNNVSEYYEFYNSTFGDDPRFSLFVRPASDWGGDRIKTFYDSLIDDDRLEEMYHKIFSNTHGITFDRNIGDLDIGSSTCSAVFKNKFTIGTTGKIYKCDDAEEDLCVGYLNESGKMILDKDKILLWQRGYRKNKPECDSCFYSCSCFHGACPKAIISGRKKSCVKAEIETDQIINYAASILNHETI